MEYTPHITNEELTLLLEHYQQKIRELKEKISSAESELESARIRMQALTINSLHENYTNDLYYENWPLAKKAEYVLSKHNEIANTRKLAEWIAEEEDGNDDEESLKNTVSALGATLKQKVDKDITFNRIIENGDIFYGLVDWFVIGEDGGLKVKTEYDRRYKRAYVVKNISWGKEI